jgi:hypothetical protein
VDARSALRDILDRRGEHTPAVIVDEARPDDAPLHEYFEWDDDVAAERHREAQARRLIRRFKITYRHTADGVPIRVREFVSIERPEADGRRGYIPTELAVQDPVILAALLRECQREAAAFRSKYKLLAEYADIVKSMLPPADDEAS